MHLAAVARTLQQAQVLRQALQVGETRPHLHITRS